MAKHAQRGELQLPLSLLAVDVGGLLVGNARGGWLGGLLAASEEVGDRRGRGGRVVGCGAIGAILFPVIGVKRGDVIGAGHVERRRLEVLGRAFGLLGAASLGNGDHRGLCALGGELVAHVDEGVLLGLVIEARRQDRRLARAEEGGLGRAVLVEQGVLACGGTAA